MISVTYTETHTDTAERRELRCDGHAGYSPGQDIVCAAVSALTGTLAAALLERGGTGVTVAEGAGMARISCAGAEAEPLFRFVLTGLRKLAQAYPRCVRVEIGGANEQDR